MREIAVVFDPERKLFLYFGVAFLAIAVGPFGTYDAMTLWDRVVFWTLDVLGGLAILVPIMHVFYHSRFTQTLPSLLRFFCGVALGALPTAAFISLLYRTFAAGLEISTPFPMLYVQVTLFSAILLLVEFVLWPMVFGHKPVEAAAKGLHEPLSEISEPKNDPPALTPLHLRLPPEIQDKRVVSISMHDHYAEIVTTAGKAMILMRLADAVDMLDGQQGQRIHRSHWVAEGEITGLRKSGRQMEVTLRDGRHLPVGATHLKQIKAWLTARNGEDTAAQ